MQAARFYRVREPLRIEDIPVPPVGDEDVLIKIEATGICGSDIHVLYEGLTPTGYVPITLGHEPSGIIAEVGRNVDDWKVGDRVVVSSIVSCGTCVNCLRGRESICVNSKLLGFHMDGAMAEYMAAPSRNLFRLPENIPFDQGAAITDAVATPFHAIARRGKLKIGETVAIIGCGGLGIHAVQLCRIGGASRIIAVDANEERLIQANKVGATETINASNVEMDKQIGKLTSGTGVDMILEFVGSPDTISRSINSLRKGGRLVVIGLGAEKLILPSSAILVWREISLIGSFGFDREDIRKLLDLAAGGRLDLTGSITASFPLAEVNTALEKLRDGVGNPVRIVIQPQ